MTYEEAVELIRTNAFNLHYVPFEIIDERLLRFAYRRNAWSVDAWMVELDKQHKAAAKELIKNLTLNIGIKRDYKEIQ